ncbi:MAG: hypothetical protein OEU54_08075 [Gemmatimonadota bacterium]|nr:hypothetical protein [Gemmatimonadota bacterium]
MRDRTGIGARGSRMALLTLLTPLACGDGSTGVRDQPVPDITLPVRVHLLTSRIPELSSALSDSQVAALIARANEVWGAAGIGWSLESVVREAAQNETAIEQALAGVTPLTSTLLASAFPSAELSGAWDVFFVPDLTFAGVPGVYFPSIPMAVSSELDPAGLGDPGRILAHELGHSLSLPHVACTAAGNLMSPGCAGSDRTRLASGQVEQARAQAREGSPAR